jgi:hypothetical protein
MPDIPTITNRVISLVNAICGTIGPRPAGSSQERQSQEYLGEILSSEGWTTRFIPFNFPKPRPFQPYLAIAGLFFLLFGAIHPVTQPVLILSPFLVASLPIIYAKFLAWFNSRISSQNLLLTPPNAVMGELQIILSAHLDTARNQPALPAMVRPIQSRLMEIVEVLSWIIAFLGMSGLVRATPWMDTSTLLRWLSGGVGILLIIWDLIQQLAGQSGYTQGANDNASGAAFATVIANHMVKSHPELKIGVLLTGAEEPGLFGSQAAAAFLKENQFRPQVINLDMLGAGTQIGFVIRSGRLGPRYTDPGLNRIIQTLEPDSVPIDYRYRGGDFISFLKQGFRSISLEMTDAGGAPPHYHQPTDTPETLQPSALEKMAAFLVRFLEKVGEMESNPGVPKSIKSG